MIKLTTRGTSSASDIEKWRGGRGGKSNGMPCPVQIMKVSEKEVWRNGLRCKTKEVQSICRAFWVNRKTDGLG